MTNLVKYSLNPPFKGMATQIDPIIAGSQGYFANAVNVTYDEVAINPMPKVMQEVAQVSPNPVFLFYHYGYGWIADGVTVNGFYNWGVRGGRSSAGFTVSYTTATGIIPTTYNKPKKYFGINNQVEMGIDPPAAAPVPTPGARGNITAAYTYVNGDGSNGDDRIESNPSPYTAAFADGGSLAIVWPASSRVTGVHVYATLDGDPDGTLYYVNYLAKTGSPPGTSFSLSTYYRNLGRELNWGAGGYLENQVSDIYYDHSPPGLITCFSDKFHGTSADTPDNRDGTLFYAINDTVGWTATGEPEYFPEANKFQLPGNVMALVTVGTQTYAFLIDQVWAFSGQDSTSITARQVATRRGVGIGKAKTVQSTPYGIIYASREGLVIFNGSEARLICTEVFREFSDTDHWCSAYVDGIYYLCKPEDYYGPQTWKVDLRNPSEPIATKSTIHFYASHTLGIEESKTPESSEITLPANPVYSQSSTYSKNQRVFIQNYSSLNEKQSSPYFCSLVNSNTNNEPTISQASWALIPDGKTYLSMRGYMNYGDFTTPWSQLISPLGGRPMVWNSTQSYVFGNVVFHNNNVYRATGNNTNNNPESVGSSWAIYNDQTAQGGWAKSPVCPYTEDIQVNGHDPLPVTIQTHPRRLGPIHSISRARMSRVDGSGSATFTFSFDSDNAKSYSKDVSVTNSSSAKFMLPMSLYGDNFSIKVQSTTDFTLRQVELEASTKR